MKIIYSGSHFGMFSSYLLGQRHLDKKNLGQMRTNEFFPPGDRKETRRSRSQI